MLLPALRLPVLTESRHKLDRRLFVRRRARTAAHDRLVGCVHLAIPRFQLLPGLGRDGHMSSPETCCPVGLDPANGTFRSWRSLPCTILVGLAGGLWRGFAVRRGPPRRSQTAATPVTPWTWRASVRRDEPAENDRAVVGCSRRRRSGRPRAVSSMACSHGRRRTGPRRGWRSGAEDRPSVWPGVTRRAQGRRRRDWALKVRSVRRRTWLERPVIQIRK